MVNIVDEMYWWVGFDWIKSFGDFEIQCDVVVLLSLFFDLGMEWNYLYLIDVVGWIVELVVGVDFDWYFWEYIFEFLDMVDIGFCVVDSERDCFVLCYYLKGKELKVMFFDDV